MSAKDVAKNRRLSTRDNPVIAMIRVTVWVAYALAVVTMALAVYCLIASETVFGIINLATSGSLLISGLSLRDSARSIARSQAMIALHAGEVEQ